MGVFGVGGSLWANRVVMGGPTSATPGTELLIVLGATLNENNTHGWLPGFVPSKALVRVDINPNNVLGKEYEDVFVTGDVSTFMRWLQASRGRFDAALSSTVTAREAWLAEIRKTPYYDTDADRVSDAVPMHPARVIAELRRAAPRDTVMVVDSGAHTFFTGHNWSSYGPNAFLLLSTTGPMGYGVAMTIGAKLARPERPHCAVVGDGSLLMHGMEIHTAVRYKVPMVITVINNSALGNVYLRALHESPEAVRLAEIPTQQWAEFACSLGAAGVVVQHPDDLPAVYARAFATEDRPFVIDARCGRDYPTPNTQEGP
jgi:acetolactate synthase-1/2/3 large subunit